MKPPKKEVVHLKIYNLEQADEEIRNLSEAGEKFVTETTNTTTKVKWEGKNKIFEYWYLRDSKSEWFLIMLNELKAEIRQNAETVLKCQNSKNIEDIRYFNFRDTMRDMVMDSGSVYEFSNVFESDISHAYYRAAYVLGFISKPLYRKIITKMVKHDRLRLMGCTATMKVIKHYHGTEVIHKEVKSDPILREAWFKICHYIDTALLNLKSVLGNKYLFYWVDGIYFTQQFNENRVLDSETERRVRDIEHKFNLRFKTIPIEKFELTNYGNYVEVKVFKPNNPKPKRFFPNKEQIKSYSIETLNQFNKQFK